jgi:hypothetical protein
MRVEGTSMIDAGIFDKDIAVVDRSLDPVMVTSWWRWSMARGR